MAAPEFPNSFKDPLYASLDARTEAKLGLPTGLLSSIRLNGEKSNHDQVSEAAARSPYQFIPSTRRAIIEKYGIDPLLNPENASEAAGLLLKEGLDRNKGDAALAAAEYHAGPDRKGWGPRTRAYVQRVTAGMAPMVDLPGDAPAAAVDERGLPRPAVNARPALGSMPDGSPSTFERLSDQQEPQASPIANIFAAYQAGKMTPAQSQAFEADVRGGKLMLPRGAALNSAATGAPAENDPSANVVNAYNAGRMSPAQAEVFRRDVAAKTFRVPEGMALTAGTGAGVPLGPGESRSAGTPDAPQTVTDKLIGTGEAALQTVTGLTGGAVGMIGGGALGVAQDVAGLIREGSGYRPAPGTGAEALTQQGMQALTYAPRTPSGQAQGEAVGQAMQNLLPVMPMTAELGALARGAAPLARAATDATRAAPELVKGASASLADRLSMAMPGRDGAAKATPGTMGSVGAAGVDMATQRRAAAAELAVPVDLTKGQAERGFAQQQFERETAKSPEAGAPLRERFAQQNENVLKNFDAYVDQTGAEATNLRAAGATVDAALQKQFAADKSKVRVAYKNAEKAGEMEAPVALDSLVAHLNESAPDAATAPILDVARKRAVRLGIATEGADGELMPAQVPLKIAETMRQAIGRATDFEPTNVRQATIMKGLIDDATDGAGGTLYAAARKERARLAQNYENRAVVNKLITLKRGTSDRNVALEDVFSHSILDGSLDDVRNVRRVLQRAGTDGQQGWRELQGQTLQHLKAEATKNVARDIRGNEIVSAAGLDRAIKKLDADGKLDFVFGKVGAERLRTMNDVAKDIYTSPPGSVNSSNTASIVLAALDMSLSGVVGLPLPVASGVRMLTTRLRDRSLAARVHEALTPPKKPPPMRPAPRPTAATTF